MGDVIHKPSQVPGPPGVYGYQVIVEEGDVGRVSVFGLLNTILRYRRVLVGLTTGIALLGVGLGLALRGYSAESSFAPHVTEGQGSQLAGLAAQFGVSLGGLTGGESIDFYAALLQSRELLEQAVVTEYRFASSAESGDSLRGTLVELFGVGGRTPQERVTRAVRRLTGAMTVQKDPDAGIIGLTVHARWAGLAEAINGRLLELVNEFNLNKRQTQARAERTFVQARVAESKAELEGAEDALAGFLQANRQIDIPPRLRAEQARLQRRVDLAQQVYLTLAQALEQSQLDVVRNTPLITVVDSPLGSARKSGSMMIVLFVSAFVGFLVGLGLAFGRDYLIRERSANPEAYQELAGLAQATLRDLTLGLGGQSRGGRV